MDITISLATMAGMANNLLYLQLTSGLFVALTGNVHCELDYFHYKVKL